MEVYVLHWNRRRLVFHAEPVTATEPGEAKAGWRRWVEARWVAWQERLRKAEGGAGAVLRKVENFLRRFEAPDEAMLRALRTANEIVLVHPTNVEEERVRHAWTVELRHQAGKHLLWMGVNSIVGPVLAVGLAILPGPNVIGYWFLYRAGAHAMAWMGVKRARKGGMPLTLRAEAALDAPLREGRRVDLEVVERLEGHCGLVSLREMLERRGWLRGEADSRDHDDAAVDGE